MRLIKVLPILLLLAACAPPAAGDAATSTGGPAVVDSMPAPVEEGAPAAVATPRQWTSGALSFTLESPGDGVIVVEPQVVLVGTTSVETILSVNEEIVLLPAGPFSVPVPLLEGPNAFGVVASDYEGNTIEFVLIVIYQP